MTGSTIITATKAEDDNYLEATATYMLTVVAAPVVLPEPLAFVGTFSAQSYAVAADVTVTLPHATGGTAPFSYTLTPAGSIPEGLSFTPPPASSPVRRAR